MNVGFYYHVEAVIKSNGQAFLPGYLGRFLDELARQSGRVTLYAHATRGNGTEDYAMDQSIVRVVDLGPRRSAPARTLRPGPALRRFSPADHGVDVMLVRGPSPLLPQLVDACGAVPVALLILGDYVTASPVSEMALWRRMLIRGWRHLYRRLEDRAALRALVMVNSPALARRFRQRGSAAEVVVITSLTEDAIASALLPWAESGQASSGPLRLIYTGRIAAEKGLLEAIGAIRILTSRGLDVTLNLVGIDDGFRRQLMSEARRLLVEDRLQFSGYVPVGEPLFRMLRAADMYVLPSYHEGFPSSLVEAMAAGLPAVATRVGGIPDILQDGDQVVLVDPRSEADLAGGIERVMQDPVLRRRIASEGWRWAKAHTLARSCEVIVGKLHDLVG